MEQKSEYVLRLDKIQKAVNQKLRPLGFRKLGRSHNRMTAGGLIHVVNFQMGEFPIGDYVIPGLRENLYGRFAVNLGVLLPCVHRLIVVIITSRCWNEQANSLNASYLNVVFKRLIAVRWCYP
jgi:hypothetical protein